VTPRFSIAIPAHNRAAYLQDAIRSCLAQTIGDFEVVISDDCSTEDLRAVSESFDDMRIRYSRSPARLGAAKNHQRAVSLSRGEYVVNLHSDDMLLAQYLEVAGAALGQCPRAAAVYSSVAYLDGTRIHGCQRMPRVGFADRQTYLDNRWLEKNRGVCPTSCLFRRAAFERIGGYRIDLRFAYDWDLYMRLMTAGGGVLFVPEVLALYRTHDDQASQTSAREGLYDLLHLWTLDEYAHWTPAEIADLVLSEIIESARARRSPLELWTHVRQSGMALRLALASPPALLRRVARRVSVVKARADENYRLPDTSRVTA